MSHNDPSLPAVSQLGSIRDGFGRAMEELVAADRRMVVLTGDLTESLRLVKIASEHPAQFVQLGVAEQNMIGVAAGLALGGKVAFAASFAVFSPGRTYEQIRQLVCYSNLNVKIIGGHAGLNVGPDGATHQMLEDIALTRVLPNMKVVVPCDEHQAFLATKAIAQEPGPCYLRLVREKSAVITQVTDKFQLGQAQTLIKGQDVTIVACGLMAALALQAAAKLKLQSLRAEVINLHTIKPVDEITIFGSIIKTGCLVTVEEHQLAGGMSSAILESLVGKHSVPTARLGVKDQFGESGDAQGLLNQHGLTVERIVQAALGVMAKK